MSSPRALIPADLSRLRPHRHIFPQRIRHRPVTWREKLSVIGPRSLQLASRLMRLMKRLYVDGRRHRGPDALRWKARCWRDFFEEMGGVYVKAGQIISVRTDAFSQEFCQEMSNLLDRNHPFPGRRAVQIIEEDLHVSADEIFSEFDLEPIATASLGQVHVGRLRLEGVKVAVKIRRPNVERLVAADVSMLVIFGWFFDLLGIGRTIQLTPMMKEIERIMDEELSYLNEAKACAIFRDTLKGRKHITAPRVYFHYTTDRVLVMQFLEGIPMKKLINAIEQNDMETLDQLYDLGVRRKKLAKRFYRAYVEQAFEKDILHCDLHPANVILMKDNNLGFIDFGAVAYYGPSFRARQERVIRAFARKDADEAIDALLASWEPLPRGDLDEFKSELKPYIQQFLSSGSRHGNANEKSVGHLFTQVNRVSQKVGITAPWDHLRYTRLVLGTDNTVISLDPRFRFDKAQRKYFMDRARRQAREQLRGERLGQALSEAAGLLINLPADFTEVRNRVLDSMRRGEHLYQNAISKGAYVARLLIGQIRWFMLLFLATVVGFRLYLGADGIDHWLASRTFFTFPWWVLALIVLYLAMLCRRIETRMIDFSG